MIKRFWDWQLRWPLVIDFCVCLTIVAVAHWYPIMTIYVPDESVFAGNLTSMIETLVSMAGFMLAALTIMVTFRANIKTRLPDEALNSLELILSGNHYKGIVEIFKSSIIEQLLAAAFAYVVLLHFGLCDSFWQYQIQVVIQYLAIASVTRAIVVLSKILALDH